MEYLFLYLDLFLFFFFSQFYSFPCVDFVHALLDLYLSILFFGDNVTITVFYISNSNFSLLAYKKAIDFCILTLHPATLV